MVETITLADHHRKKTIMTPLFLLNALLLAIGTCGGPTVMRLYYLHGGNRIWLASLLETGGWPLNFIPLLITYLHRRRNNEGSAAAKLYFMDGRVFLAAAVIGVLTGADDYLYAYGVSKLPVSTTALIIASQLGFTALFAFLLVRQKFTSYSINAIFLLTVGAGVLALHTSTDRPAGESKGEYYLGFFLTLAAAALYGFVLPLVELTYKKAKQAVTYTLVMEIQLVMCFFATVVCAVGMLINKDFQAIPKEAKVFELGETAYYLVLVCSAIAWQCFFLGAIGVVYSASSLVSGIILALLLPVTEVLGVICFHEKFQPEKGLSLLLALWGFLSYFYGELKHSKKKNKTQDQCLETELPPRIIAP